MLREAQAIAKLSHPNVVVVYDVGTFAESVFIAMEFVDGNTVGYWMQAETRTWPEVLKVFLAAGRGLVAAHAAGLVHRDFKPDNVMLTKDGQVRVMDFGLARQSSTGDEPAAPAVDARRLHDLVVLGSAAQAAIDLDATAELGAGGQSASSGNGSGSYLKQKLTMTGALVGTPAYMAPEQFAGMATDARTDQFAFCIALYEALYGQRPFDGDNVAMLMTNVVTGTIRAEPEGRDVPGRLRKILLRGLQTEPGERFPSMAALLAAMETDPSARPRRWILATTALALGAVALVAGARHFSDARGEICGGAAQRLAGVWELGGTSARKEDVARAFAAKGKGPTSQIFASVRRLLDGYVERWAAMYKDACEATHVHGEQSAEILDLRMTCLRQRLTNLSALTDLFTRADADVVENAVSAAGALPNLERCGDVALLRAVVQPPSDPKIRARVDAVGAEVAKARALGDSGRCVEARDTGAAATAAAKVVGYLPLLAEASYVTAEAGKVCTDAETRVSLYEEAAWAAEAAQDDEVAVSASGSAAGCVAELLRDPKRARYWIRNAEAILKRQPGHPLLEAYTLVDRGIVAMADGKLLENIDEQKRALAIKERVYGPLHLDTADSLMNVGVGLHEVGRDADAEPYARRAVETMERLLGPESARGAIASYNLGETLLGLGRTKEARAAFGRAVTTWTRVGAAPFYAAAGQESLGRVDLAEHHAADARKKLEAALPIVEGDARIAGETRVALADALWVTPRERPRAVDLVRAARKDLVATAASAEAIGKIDEWLTGHARP